MTQGAPERLVVPMAKGTLTRFFVTCGVGLVGCAFLLHVSRNAQSTIDTVARILAGIGIPFCAATAIYVGRRLFDPTPGLVLDEEGLIDRSNALGAGRVRWSEIREIRVTQSMGQRFLTVVVDDPRKFIEAAGALRRPAVEANHRLAGSPINITPKTLRLPYEELVAKTSEFYQRYGRRR